MFSPSIHLKAHTLLVHEFNNHLPMNHSQPRDEWICLTFSIDRLSMQPLKVHWSPSDPYSSQTWTIWVTKPCWPASVPMQAYNLSWNCLFDTGRVHSPWRHQKWALCSHLGRSWGHLGALQPPWALLRHLGALQPPWALLRPFGGFAATLGTPEAILGLYLASGTKK